ncbi:MAG: hypothetical protein HOV80_38330 [Polyangiaceae bacterium]|nr:hypothetical protein [Polyangiaceae bacterium]
MGARAWPLCFAAITCLVGGCSDDDLEDEVALLGTFSWGTPGNTGLSHAMFDITKLTFNADGTGRRTTLGGMCADDVQERPFDWEVDGTTVRVSMVGAESGDEDEFEIGIRSSIYSIAPELSLTRRGSVETFVFGDLCMDRYDDPRCPEGYECDDCRTYWCDEPPPQFFED